MSGDGQIPEDAYLRTLRPGVGLGEMHEVTLAESGPQEDGDEDDDDDDELEGADFAGEALEDEALEGPQRLGSYVVLSKLGEGGMGVVHAAYDPKLDRKVAIKLLRSESDGKARRRLEREAQAQARLSHPNVVQIYEIGEVEGRLFIVMEFVAGRTLKRWLERERSRAEILDVFVAAGRGLAAAHQQSLVHRDFKPDNVLVADDGRVLVMDFGLARAELGTGTLDSFEGSLDSLDGGEELPEPSGLTATGVLMGTPAYMAPEQFEGREIDPRTDQFSFCVALWEALYGRRPFVGTTFSELSRTVCAGRPSAPENVEVPGWLRAVVSRGLAVDPRQRWSDMPALLEALRSDPSYRRRKLLGAGGLLGLTAAVFMGLLFDEARSERRQKAACEQAGQEIFVDWNDETQAALARGFAETELSYAGDSWERTREVMDDYAQRWAQTRTAMCLGRPTAAGTEATPGRDEQARQDIADCLEQRREGFAGLIAAWSKLDTNTVVRATQAAVLLPTVESCVDELRLSQGIPAPMGQKTEIDAIETQLDLARALDFTGRFDEALQQSMSLLPRVEALGWRPLEAETRFLVASAQLHAGKPEAARDEGVRAYYAAVAGGDERRAMLIASKQGTFEGDRLANPARGREWCQLALMHLEHLRLGGTYYEADILANLSGVELRAGKLEEAERLGQRSLEIYRATLGPAHLQTAAAINNQGAIERAMGHYDEALASFRTALELRRLVLGPEHPEVATSIHNIGVILWQQHELDEALEILQQALALRERALGSKHPSVSMSLNALGAVLSGLGRDAESLAAFERALAIDEETLGPTHPDLAGSLTNVANLRRSMGDAERALADHRRALAIWEDALGPEHPYVAVALTNIGAVLTQQEKYDEALEVHQRALAVRETALGLEHPDVAQSLANIGAIYNISQRPALAVASFRRALAIREAALGAEHFSVVESHADLGAALYATGSLAEAQTELEASLRGLEAMGDDEEGIHAYRAVVGFQLAKVAWDRGRKSEAVDFAEEARAQQVTYEQGKVPAAEEVDLSLAEIDDWLAAHSAAPVTSK